jgi:hypothetical protein
LACPYGGERVGNQTGPEKTEALDAGSAEVLIDDVGCDKDDGPDDDATTECECMNRQFDLKEFASDELGNERIGEEYAGQNDEEVLATLFDCGVDGWGGLTCLEGGHGRLHLGRAAGSLWSLTGRVTEADERSGDSDGEMLDESHRRPGGVNACKIVHEGVPVTAGGQGRESQF